MHSAVFALHWSININKLNLVSLNIVSLYCIVYGRVGALGLFAHNELRISPSEENHSLFLLLFPKEGFAKSQFMENASPKTLQTHELGPE